MAPPSFSVAPPVTGNSHGGAEHDVYVVELNARGSLAEAHGVEILIDTAPDGRADALHPAEFLLCALAGCLIRTLHLIAPGLKVSYADAAVSLTAKGRRHPPGFETVHYEVRLATLSSEQALHRLNSAVRDASPVASLLHSTGLLSGGIIAIRRQAAHSPSGL
jgi:uncharacterized OsmC-like protein